MFYTVKEIADLLGVSKPTVQKVFNENFIEPDKIEKNKFRYYSYDKTVLVIEKLKPDFDFSILPKNTEKPLESTEKPQTNPQEFAERIEKPQSEEALERMLSIIEKQLEEKDKLIAQKNREIELLEERAERERADLQDKLAKAYSQISEMAQKAQYITAVDKTAQIMEKQKCEETDIVVEESPAAATGEPETKEVKKSLFQRLFRK